MFNGSMRSEAALCTIALMAGLWGQAAVAATQGKVGERGGFEGRDAWQMIYSDWRSHIGTPEPAFLRRGISGRDTCRLDPLPGAALDDR